MLKAILYLGLALLAFAGSLAGVLAATGNLNREALDKVMGKVPPEELAAEAAQEPDDLDPIARALKEREQSLDLRENDLREREDRVKTLEEDLRQVREELAQLLQQYEASLEQIDAAKEQARQDVAKLLEKMKPDQAADILAAKEPEEAVELLRLIPEKNRAKVIDKLDPEKASAIIDAMQVAPPPTATAAP